MYKRNRIANTHQPCPDCSVTLCRCTNCHTMHCDSEELCNYPISGWRPEMKKSINLMKNSLIHGDPVEKYVDYKSTMENRLSKKEISHFNED